MNYSLAAVSEHSEQGSSCIWYQTTYSLSSQHDQWRGEDGDKWNNQIFHGITNSLLSQQDWSSHVDSEKESNWAWQHTITHILPSQHDLDEDSKKNHAS